MNDLLKSLSSLEWWFTAVAVAFAINVLSSYAKPTLDRGLKLIQTWWATRTAKLAQEREKRIEDMSNDPELRNYRLIEHQEQAILAYGTAIASIIVLTTGPDDDIKKFFASAALFGVSIRQFLIQRRKWDEYGTGCQRDEDRKQAARNATPPPPAAPTP